jgi:DNA-binding NarL/FixJ family response regulator
VSLVSPAALGPSTSPVTPARRPRLCSPPRSKARTSGPHFRPVREMQVLGLMAVGMSNQEIADELVVVLDTVKKHVGHIFDKLGAANRTQAVARARVMGLVR